MNTITKEWLQNTITGIESIIDDKSFVCSEIAFEIGQVNNILTAFKIALASLAAVSDERAAYELFMEKRFGESVDRRRAKMVIENTWHGIWRLAGLSGVTAPPCFREANL